MLMSMEHHAGVVTCADLAECATVATIGISYVTCQMLTNGSSGQRQGVMIASHHMIFALIRQS